MKAKFIVIGFGWRADFFYRIAKMVPERFEICAGSIENKTACGRSGRKRRGIRTENLDEALKTIPDFACCVCRVRL